jgi:hypothetical protein
MFAASSYVVATIKVAQCGTMAQKSYPASDRHVVQKAKSLARNS